eukprot:Nitzschia sp. Nitz4//scaffold28_size193895//1603//3705//NITZ4_001618-RA/size193895-processed-gene-0.244-mRNA-1//-1//CDS//3329545841//3892//frame0
MIYSQPMLLHTPTVPPTSLVMTDPALPHIKPLQNRFLLGDFKNISLRVPQHDMDVVIMATGTDPVLAIAIHNLFHLCGFRRFIFVVNNSTKDCSNIFDLVPQHYPSKPHLCLNHTSFYSNDEKQRLVTNYPQLNHGSSGKLRRGNKMVNVPRLGWYLQQFSKLLVPSIVPDLSTKYLAVDGDLIFTRPFQFSMPNGKYKLPTTSKSPKHWKYFVEWIFSSHDERWKDESESQQNYVVGWMVLDRVIVQDMIRDMDRLIVDANGEKFPFSILNEGERIINTTFFSEFYVYARYALRHPSNPYDLVALPEPARNPGNFKYTCKLTKSTYTGAQRNAKLAPFLIWEEHKHHAFNACPDKDSSHHMTQLSNIGIWHDFHLPPWGGGNQFLLALRKGLEEYNLSVQSKSDVNGSALIQSTSQVILANSITFKGKKDVLQNLKARNELALVHRVDGPYYSTRYGLPLNLTSPPKKIPEEDRKTKQINREFACATVFQSKWSMQMNVNIGLNLRNPVIIPNTVDSEIFFPNSTNYPLQNRKIRIVATSHSDNARKGFDTMLWMDTHLDFERFEVSYMGGWPRHENSPTNIRVLVSGGSESVAAFLRSGDIYLAPSRYEPASNAVMEALACGLPVLYQEGSSHGDLVGNAGRGFTTVGSPLLDALEELIQEYDACSQAIQVPHISDVAKSYLAILRWCFYMKRVQFEG